MFGLVLLIGTGILMTVLTGCFQVTRIGHWFKHTLGSMFTKKVMGHTKEKGTISPFLALCTALAATVGTGNIAGVAAAICIGGAGAVFWMWIAAFFGMMMFPNLIGVVVLCPLVVKITKNYVARKIKNEDVAPILSYDETLQKEAVEEK